MLLKRSLSMVRLSIPHYPYTGNLMGQDQSHIKSIYGFQPELLVGHESKKLNISLPKVRINKDKRLIFLDQPNGRIMPIQNWSKCRENTIDFIKSTFPDFHLFYKRHHKTPASEPVIFLESGFKEIENNECIESYFNKNPFNVVISYNSSALFNLKSLYSEDLRVISIGNRRLFKGDKVLQ